MPYIGKSPEFGIRSRFIFDATASQTSFSGSDVNGITLTYTDTAYMDVFQNGVLLKAATDYTATTGTSVVLETGASVNDVVSMIIYDIFTVGDTVSAGSGGNFGGNVGMGGTLAVTGVPTFTGRSVHSGGITVANAGQIGSVGDADAMAIASNGVVTFSQAPVFSAGGAGGLVLLLNSTFSSSRATEAISSTYINSTFDEYILFFNLRQADDNQPLSLRVLVGGTVQTGNIYAFETAGTSGSAYESSNATSAFRLTKYGVGNDTGECVTGRLHIQNVNSTTFPFMYSGYTMANNEHGNPEGSSLTGSLTVGNVDKVVNGLSLNSGSNLTSGTIKLYGLVK